MKTIFKIGDKVFDIRYGWGEVTDLDCGELSVTFLRNYNWYDELEKKLLSFTEYTLEGFSQERPHEFKDGDAVLVKESCNEYWVPLVFKEYKDGKYFTYGLWSILEWDECKPFKTEEDDNKNN